MISHHLGKDKNCIRIVDKSFFGLFIFFHHTVYLCRVFIYCDQGYIKLGNSVFPRAVSPPSYYFPPMIGKMKEQSCRIMLHHIVNLT